MFSSVTLINNFISPFPFLAVGCVFSPHLTEARRGEALRLYYYNNTSALFSPRYNESSESNAGVWSYTVAGELHDL